MVFSSQIFLFYFLPLVLLAYALAPKGVVMGWLIVVSWRWGAGLPSSPKMGADFCPREDVASSPTVQCEKSIFPRSGYAIPLHAATRRARGGRWRIPLARLASNPPPG